MGRKKTLPIRSKVVYADVVPAIGSSKEHDLVDSDHPKPIRANNSGGNPELSTPFYVEVDRKHWTSREHLDIAEIVLKNIASSNGDFDQIVTGGWCIKSNVSLRFRLPNMEDDRFRLGHWPILLAETTFLEFVRNDGSNGDMIPPVIFCGIFDAPDEGVSGLVHLVNLKMLTLRPVMESRELTSPLTFRVRVEILKGTFDACESLLDIPRQPWRKSMMNAMSWLRPDVMTSEAKYGINQLDIDGLRVFPEIEVDDSKMDPRFDVTGFYEAIKPSKEAPMLEDDLPDLLPELRPYQRRAAYWMVQRETRYLKSSSEKITTMNLFAPLCVPITFLERDLRMFYNPFCGTVSLNPQSSALDVSGGILADEMGLGKTVELLACIFKHRNPSLDDCVNSHDEALTSGHEIKRIKQERVECVCGAVSESYKYKGLWVQCDICDAWQHADCVGYFPEKKSRPCKGKVNIDSEKDLAGYTRKGAKRKDSSSILEMKEDHICSICSELMEVSYSTITSGATLIVCPASILAQWYSEIIRHTRPGSLKTCIYEGARNLTPPSTLKNEMTKLASADIVLTSYDILKEDLSHDSDRHDGDRRTLRFQKRYPVVPTLLTRIYWWRLCLDEAQMVESSTAAVTEMALRLRARHRWCVTGTPIQRKLDDVYGLLRFLGARPFDVYKWWAEVIRDPYERRDVIAMEFTHNFFKQIMWRSTKAHVSDELGLPPQEDCVSWLRFSQIEEHFYRKQHESCINCAQELIDHFKDNFLKRNSASGYDASCNAFLSHSDASKLLTPLLKLRQACCHPQVGSSGLRSLQQSPMTMDEILEVLISKTKIEGEEALRRIVVALNGLAAIAIIEQDHSQAVSLYREALAIAEENSSNFRLDPLLSLHIHYNLMDLIPLATGHLHTLANSELFHENSQEKPTESCNGKPDQWNVKRRKISEHRDAGLGVNGGSLEQHVIPSMVSDPSTAGVEGDLSMECEALQVDSSLSVSHDHLRKTCESIKHKYLSMFVSKLSVAQQEFKSSYMQVLSLSKEIKTQHKNWWLQTLGLIEQNKDISDGLIKKIDQTIMDGSSRASSRFRSITGLKYTIQNGLDKLEASRKSLFERLLEIDQTMDKPKEEDIKRVQSCPNCETGDGPLCIHCELDDMFQEYEARLFLLKKGNSTAASAEEAIDLQKKKTELNLFFRGTNVSTDSSLSTDLKKGQRHLGTNVVVSRSPSHLEVIFGVIKSYSKSQLGREGASSATKQLLLFESMRKEFAHARSLSRAQAQMLRAHDEIRMSTSRLRLREFENEPTAINVLSKEELIPSSLQFSNDKFMSLSSLARIKGQLRYLKGLVLSKQQNQQEVAGAQFMHQEINSTTSSNVMQYTVPVCRVEDVPCPICHEKLGDQKMVFQCGHVTCCRCFLELTEQAVARSGKCQQKWVMCPTCRQHTDFGNIAFVDDNQSEQRDMMIPDSFQGLSISEISIKVRGSYGTKIEAITRRILWIQSINQEAKVIVFSSWNDVLDVLQHAFSANSISYIRMRGGRKSQVAIAQFKEQKNTNQEERGIAQDMPSRPKFIQVLLLLMRHGANGLNLLEAQHVILIEPLLNPAAEAQAINRVHRIGQEKKTYVHRFIVKNTVEESIYKLHRSGTVNAMVSPKSKLQDQPSLTLRDIESLFTPIAPSEGTESDAHVPVGSLTPLPPSVAAGLAAERRLMESSGDNL